MIGNETGAVKITSVDDRGTDIVQYTLPRLARLAGRMLFEQYNNVSYEAVEMSDVPDEIRAALEQAAAEEPTK
jgi:hypothetical protein